jgi:hypothetical protein
VIAAISMGDVVRAWRMLGARTDDERRAIARLLGFDLRPPGPLPEQPPPTRRASPTPAVAGDPIAAGPPEVTTGEAVRLDLVPFSDVHVNPVELPADGLPRPTVAPPAVIEPLFAPSWSRAIASTLTARPAAAGPIDVDRTVELLARRQPVRWLPRRSRLVTATEVVVVIDTRATLGWFRDDAAWLCDRLDAVSRATVGVVEADGAPVVARSTASGAPPDDRGDDEPWPEAIRIGAHGRVVALTDLGLGSPWVRGDPARAEAWAALAIALRAREASLVIVTPVPIERIPHRLARLAPCIYWDRSTRPAAVHRAIRSAT